MRGHSTDTFPPYGQYTTPRLLTAYGAAPERLRRVLEGISGEQMVAHPRPGKWSVLEIIMHLADAEVVGAGRMRLAWSQPGSTFVGYDQDCWCQALDYQGAGRPGLEAALELFAALRRTTGTLLRRAAPEDWTARWGVHPEYGRITLRNLLELYADHGERHLEQILRLRDMLGHPVDIPLLLPERLY